MKAKVWNKRDPNVPKDAVYVGRPTKWGNPFPLNAKGTNRDEVIRLYEDYLLNVKGLEGIEELEGKDLVCYCAPKPCHADILLRYANYESGSEQ